MSRLGRLLEQEEDPYAGVDIATAARLGGILWAVAGVLVALLLPLAPPDEPLGDAGWAVAGGLVGAAFGFGFRIARLGARVSPNELYLHSVAAIGSVTALVWLSGGLRSPYAQLYLVSIVYTAMVHPFRRVVAYLGLVGVALFSPLVYDEWDRRELAGMGTAFLLWLALALIAVYFMTGVRRQRQGLASESERARRQARLDALTGLENRRAFDEALAAHVERARGGGTLSVVVGDLDGFKQVNDAHGHLAGDAVLRAVGGVLRKWIRRPDRAFRWGGDEFAVLLPGTDLEAAGRVAGRVEAAVREGVRRPDGEPLTISCGAAQLRPDQSGHDLLAAADDAMRRGKGEAVARP